MRVAIIGTRGIPNEYGGYEQLATYLAEGLVDRGHKVVVYNSSQHTQRYQKYKGVEMVYRWDPEKLFKSASQFIYDLLCIRHLKANRPDVILNLGYTSSTIWKGFFPKAVPVVTHMDGLEWQRSKYTTRVQRFLQKAEKWAVQMSEVCISDNPEITSYLQAKFSIQPIEIAYGAKAVKPTAALPNQLYDLLMARLEPENNIETIIKAVLESNSEIPLKIVGKHNRFGQQLQMKYPQKQIQFLGGIYNQQEVEKLRQQARIYFHGHSVGGTNPSLLEAMASGCCIYANSNPFNRAVLKSNACYFKDYIELAQQVDLYPSIDWKSCIDSNLLSIEQNYQWESIINQYEKMLLALIE